MPLADEGTVKQLQWIHHFLFQDVYVWAAQIRTIDMSKGGGRVFKPLQLFTTKSNTRKARCRTIICCKDWIEAGSLNV